MENTSVGPVTSSDCTSGNDDGDDPHGRHHRGFRRWQQGRAPDDSCQAAEGASRACRRDISRGQDQEPQGIADPQDAGAQDEPRASRPRRRWGAGLWLRLPVLRTARARPDRPVPRRRRASSWPACSTSAGPGGEVGGALTDGARYLVGVDRLRRPGRARGRRRRRRDAPVPAQRPADRHGRGVPVRLAHAGAGRGHVRPRPARRPARRVGARLRRGPRRRRGRGPVHAPSISAVSQTGAHIVAVFLFLAALLLLTGATIAGVLNATRTSIRGTTRALRETSAGIGALAPRPRPERLAPGAREEPVRPPEAEDPQKLVVRATHVEAPPIDGRRDALPRPVRQRPAARHRRGPAATSTEAPPSPRPSPSAPEGAGRTPTSAGVTSAKPAPRGRRGRT